jgi:hypothetical protein
LFLLFSLCQNIVFLFDSNKLHTPKFLSQNAIETGGSQALKTQLFQLKTMNSSALGEKCQVEKKQFSTTEVITAEILENSSVESIAASVKESKNNLQFKISKYVNQREANASSLKQMLDQIDALGLEIELALTGGAHSITLFLNGRIFFKIFTPPLPTSPLDFFLVLFSLLFFFF